MLQAHHIAPRPSTDYRLRIPEEKSEHMPEVGRSRPSQPHHEMTGYHKIVQTKKYVSKDVMSEAGLTLHGRMGGYHAYWMRRVESWSIFANSENRTIPSYETFENVV